MTRAAAIAALVLVAASATARADEPVEATDPAALFTAASGALASDRPSAAIASFEALADRGVVDPVVSYDRGLAYAARVRAASEQPGDLGRAAHGFEEARELTHDGALARDATAALELVRAELARRRARGGGGVVELAHGVSLGRSIVRLLPENAWAWLAALASFALAVGIVLRARAATPRRKVTGTTTCAVAGGVFLLSVLLVHSARDARLRLREAVVLAPNTRILDDKRVAQPAVAPLAEGARVQLVEEAPDYSRVRSGYVEGWVPTAALLPLAKRL